MRGIVPGFYLKRTIAKSGRIAQDETYINFYENRGYFCFSLIFEAVEHCEREGIVYVVAHVGVENVPFRSRKRRRSAEKRKLKIGKFGEFHMDDIM